MASRGSFVHQRRKAARAKQSPPTVEHLLEEGSLSSLREAKKASEGLLKYHWDFYSELAYQRTQIQAELIKSLQDACIRQYELSGWSRVVRLKYSLHPFCTIGSMRVWGGRFNIGEGVNPGNLAAFPALYLAETHETALNEVFGQGKPSHQGLLPNELGLANASSYAFVSISGIICSVLDLTKDSTLDGFAKLLSRFKITTAILNAAKANNIPAPKLVRKPSLLRKTFLLPEWKKEPTQFDVPSNSQIFGQLANMAGIEGILYPSTKGGRNCLAIFPNNFENSDSYLALDDELPATWMIKKVDSSNFLDCMLTASDIERRSTA